MHPRKEQYAKQIYNFIDQYCEANTKIKFKGHAMPLVLGVSDIDAQKLINKILIGLPDCFFYLIKPERMEEMTCFIAQKYVLFQAQENIDDELFPILLINFINNLVEDIMLRYYS